MYVYQSNIVRKVVNHFFFFVLHKKEITIYKVVLVFLKYQELRHEHEF